MVDASWLAVSGHGRLRYMVTYEFCILPIMRPQTVSSVGVVSFSAMRTPRVITIQRHMQRYNFNVIIPLSDYLLGTIAPLRLQRRDNPHKGTIVNLSTLHSAASYPHSVSKTTTAITAHFDKQRHPFRRFLFASPLLCGISADAVEQVQPATIQAHPKMAPRQMAATVEPIGGAAAFPICFRKRCFNQIFSAPRHSPRPGAFYTYQSFVDAARAFPGFATQGTMDDRKRELAAFLANISHETTGGWATAPDGPYSWVCASFMKAETSIHQR